MPSAKWWRAQADSCCRIAREVDSLRLRLILVEMADEYQSRAETGRDGRSLYEPAEEKLKREGIKGARQRRGAHAA